MRSPTLSPQSGHRSQVLYILGQYQERLVACTLGNQRHVRRRAHAVVTEPGNAARLRALAEISQDPLLGVEAKIKKILDDLGPALELLGVSQFHTADHEEVLVTDLYKVLQRPDPDVVYAQLIQAIHETILEQVRIILDSLSGDCTPDDLYYARIGPAIALTVAAYRHGRLSLDHATDSIGHTLSWWLGQLGIALQAVNSLAGLADTLHDLLEPHYWHAPDNTQE